jgi:hypothetical protein
MNGSWPAWTTDCSAKSNGAATLPGALVPLLGSGRQDLNCDRPAPGRAAARRGSSAERWPSGVPQSRLTALERPVRSRCPQPLSRLRSRRPRSRFRLGDHRGRGAHGTGPRGDSTPARSRLSRRGRLHRHPRAFTVRPLPYHATSAVLPSPKMGLPRGPAVPCSRATIHRGHRLVPPGRPPTAAGRPTARGALARLEVPRPKVRARLCWHARVTPRGVLRGLAPRH